MRPSSKALLDVAGVFQADPSAPASAIWAQLKEQVFAGRDTLSEKMMCIMLPLTSDGIKAHPLDRT